MPFHLQTEHLKTWLETHGLPLQLGLMVCTVEQCEWTDFRGGTFMITSICFDDRGINIGLNDDGRHDDFTTAYDGFRVEDLRLANKPQ